MDNKKGPVGVLGAMDSEVAILIEKMNGRREETHAGMTCHCGFFSDVPAVVVRCGIGKVNAARAAQMLIDIYSPRVIINNGIAGGLASWLHVGDIVVGAKLVEHDFDVSPFGYVRGALMPTDDPKKPTWFVPEASVAQKLLQAAIACAPGREVRPGCIASGDVFVADAGLKKQLQNLFQADAAEMEGAAIAHVAQYAGTPFAVLRVISDLANGEAPASFDEFEKETAALSAQIILEYCRLGA